MKNTISRVLAAQQNYTENIYSLMVEGRHEEADALCVQHLTEVYGSADAFTVSPVEKLMQVYEEILSYPESETQQEMFEAVDAAKDWLRRQNWKLLEPKLLAIASKFRGQVREAEDIIGTWMLSNLDNKMSLSECRSAERNFRNFMIELFEMNKAQKEAPQIETEMLEIVADKAVELFEQEFLREDSGLSETQAKFLRAITERKSLHEAAREVLQEADEVVREWFDEDPHHRSTRLKNYYEARESIDRAQHTSAEFIRRVLVMCEMVDVYTGRA